MPTPTPLSYSTLGALIDDGYSITAYCGCARVHGRQLDLVAIAERLGREHSTMFDDLAPKLKCQHCGSRPEAFTLRPPS